MIIEQTLQREVGIRVTLEKLRVWLAFEFSEVETRASLDVDTNAFVDDVRLAVHYYTSNLVVARMLIGDTAELSTSNGTCGDGISWLQPQQQRPVVELTMGEGGRRPAIGIDGADCHHFAVRQEVVDLLCAHVDITLRHWPRPPSAGVETGRVRFGTRSACRLPIARERCRSPHRVHRSGPRLVSQG